MWTKISKKGWDDEGLKYFDEMVQKEKDDRCKYEEFLKNNCDEVPCDKYHYDDGIVEEEQDNIVTADEIIPL